MSENALVLFDLEWNIGYRPYTFNYHGVEQVFRGEIIEIGAVKVDRRGNVLDTFSVHLRPRIFRKLQHHIAQVTGLTQADLDRGEPIVQGLRRFLAWCGPNAAFAEWGLDDVPVLKQNLFLANIDESQPTEWYDLQRIFLAQRPRGEGEGMTLESVVTRLGIPMDRPFHDALSDTLYTADVCRAIDLEKGLAEYPDEAAQLRESLCPPPGDYRDFQVFRGYVDKEAWRLVPEIRDTACPICGAVLQPDEIWQKKGSNAVYTLGRCPCCADTESPAAAGVFVRYKASRRDGLHWAFARCTELPDAEKLDRWRRQRAQTLERLKRRAEKSAAGGDAPAGAQTAGAQTAGAQTAGAQTAGAQTAEAPAL
jgi:inhibitor of KinA sporulation pathway (predicted exonuclease)